MSVYDSKNVVLVFMALNIPGSSGSIWEACFQSFLQAILSSYHFHIQVKVTVYKISAVTFILLVSLWHNYQNGLVLFIYCFFFKIFIYLLILHPSWHPTTVPPLFLAPPLQIPPFVTILLREWEAPLGYHPTLGHQVTAGLSASSPTKA
jgi:hypothetical protein